ncbi:MAG: ATP-binding cassette domain-containing protein [Candidatus Latescibacteria bacterium]|nr:ATP-binding cassette domain-containing protein [Candidatus Latescibacterota bacterium]
MVSAQNIGKQFASGIEALTAVDLQVPEGDFVSLVGPSGCGKSTLLRLIAGLSEPSSGILTVDGLQPTAARRQRQDLAYVFQDATLLPWRTVEQNVALPLELRHSPRAQRNERVQEILHMVGLEAFARAYPNQLSGGMRMRASIARALVTRPGLLLLDEPFGALDELSRQRLNEELLKLWEAHRWTGIFVTHNVFEAVFLSRRVLVMSPRPGRLVADIAVTFPDPRGPALRAAPEFTRLAGEVAAHLGATLA